MCRLMQTIIKHGIYCDIMGSYSHIRRCHLANHAVELDIVSI